MKIEFERMLMPVSKYSGMYVQDLHGYKVEKNIVGQYHLRRYTQNNNFLSKFLRIQLVS